MPSLFNKDSLPASENEIDFSDLEREYALEFENNFDNLIVVDGLPKVDESKYDKLITVVQKIFKKYGTLVQDNIVMPMSEKDGKNTSEGFLFLEFENAEQAALAIKHVNGYPFDKKHTLAVNKFTDVETYSALSNDYIEPELEEYVEKEHLLSHLSDSLARDQFVTLIGDNTSIVWNNRTEAPESLFSRKLWTETYTQWSPQGTYLCSLHPQGVALWGGASWNKIVRFVHPGVKLIDFSPSERYIVTWSNDPIVAGSGAAPGATSPFGEENEGHQICIWDVKTGVLLRSFPNTQQTVPDSDSPTKITWPVFKWSPNDVYFARVIPGQMLSIYSAPDMGLVDKKSLKVEGIIDFEWAPAHKKVDKKGESKTKEGDDMLAYWTPELANTPARVTLISVPSKEILRTKNLFNVSDCKLHWHKNGELLAVRVNRFTKSKKSTFSNVEIFRVREKDIPVEVIEIKDTILQFAWEPSNNQRFGFIATGDAPPTAPTAPGMAPPTPKTNVSFYGREIKKGSKNTVSKDEFKLITTLDKKTVNSLVWSPKGRHFVLATLRSKTMSSIEFWDIDFELESKKDSSSNLHMIGSPEHYGLTDIEWDPTGRYVITSSSMWHHEIENGFCIWDFKGTPLYKKPIENFKQILWRPRPKSLLSMEQKRKVRKNLNTYSKQFDEEDAMSRNAISAAELAHRKRLNDEWKAWRSIIEKQLADKRMDSSATQLDDKEEEIEEWVEEVVEEFEEVVEE
ncbi:translation initiation factor eIF-3b [Neoconidiobolus thromboides FSU 785]|nr:translation initiation factor eIF-3b [Neoconidiobolus thromboides FSU 785]